MATVFKSKQQNTGLNILGELFHSTPHRAWNITQLFHRLHFDKLSGALSGSVRLNNFANQNYSLTDLTGNTEIYTGECHIWQHGRVYFYEAAVMVKKSSGNKLSLQIETNGKVLINPNFEATISEMVTINDANDWVSVYRLYQGNQLIGTLKEGWLHLCFVFNEKEVFFLGESLREEPIINQCR